MLKAERYFCMLTAQSQQTQSDQQMKRREKFALLAGSLSFLLVLLVFLPLWQPLFNKNLWFSFGDASLRIGSQGRAERAWLTFGSLDPATGTPSFNTNRAFWIEGPILWLTAPLSLTDSQQRSLMMFAALLCGTLGLGLILRLYVKDFALRFYLFAVLLPFYFLNFWSVERMIFTWHWAAYAAMPLLLALGLIFWRTGRHVFLWAYTGALVVFGVPPHPLLYLIILHVFLLLYFLLASRGKRRRVGAFALLPLTILGLLNLPSLWEIFSGLFYYSVQVTRDHLELMSRRGDLIRIFSFTNAWWPRVEVDNFPLASLYRFTNWALVGLFFSLPLWTLSRKFVGEKGRRRRLLRARQLIWLSLVTAAVLLLTAQGLKSTLLSALVKWSSEFLPLAAFAPLRSWARLVLPVPALFTLAVVVFAGTWAATRREAKIRLFLLLAALFLLTGFNIASSPSLIYLREVHAPANLPRVYQNLVSFLGKDYKTLWLFPLNPTRIKGISRMLSDITKPLPGIEGQAGTTYPEHLSLPKLFRQLEPPLPLMQALNFGKIVKRRDMLGKQEYAVAYDDWTCKDFQGFFEVCDSPYQPLGRFRLLPPELVWGDKDFLLPYAYAKIAKERAIFMGLPSEEILSRAKYIITGPETDALRMLITQEPDVIVLPPARHTKRFNPARVWSRSATEDPLHGPWHPLLRKWGLRNWQDDYGWGLAYTWSPGIIPWPRQYASRAEENERILYSLDGGKISFEAQDPEVLKVETSLNGNKRQMRAQMQPRKEQRWAIMRSNILPVQPETFYRIVLRMSGKQTRKLHAKVLYYDGRGKEVGVHYVFPSQSGDFAGVERVTTVLTPPRTSALLIQILARTFWGQGSAWEVEKAEIVDLSNLLQPNNLPLYFKVSGEDMKYVILARLLFSPRGGQVVVKLDGKTLREVDTQKPFTRFGWRELGEEQLTPGRHILNLVNRSGFNAVNVIVLVPAERRQEFERKISKILGSRKLIQFFEPEDIWAVPREGREVTADRRGKAGSLLSLKPGESVETSLDIPKHGWFTPVLRLAGNATLALGDTVFQARSDELQEVQLSPLYLRKGRHSFRFEARGRVETRRLNFSKGEELKRWREMASPEFNFRLLEDALLAELRRETPGWKIIAFPSLQAKMGARVGVSFLLKSKGAASVHLKAMELNEHGKVLVGKTIKRLSGGESSWKRVRTQYAVQNPATKAVRFEIWQRGKGETNATLSQIKLKTITVWGYQPILFDFFSLVEGKGEKALSSDLGERPSLPARISSAEQISPTKFKVEIEARRPFILALAEPYNSRWVAEAGGRKATSFPLLGTINGFYFEPKGEKQTLVIYFAAEKQKLLVWLAAGLSLFFVVWFYLRKEIARERKSAAGSLYRYHKQKGRGEK
jgi:hypothetical protein